MQDTSKSFKALDSLTLTDVKPAKTNTKQKSKTARLQLKELETRTHKT